MIRNPRPPVRQAAINASTVFAVTLAIVAGLIFAWVFKVVILDRKPRPQEEPPRIKLTVAAVNLLDKMEVLPVHVKTISVTPEAAAGWEKVARDRGTTLLKGNQPVKRVTKKAVRAEDPMFEDEFEPFEYPRPVSSLMEKGKRAVILEVPAKQTMIQVDDKVDVLCSLANEDAVFGPAGSSATAALAKGLKVVARFNTTRKGAQPPRGDNRTYTLESDPWQAAILELARTIGGTFSLSVVSDTSQGDDNPIVNTSVAGTRVAPEDEAYKLVEANYARNNRVTVTDLALLFGVTPPPPEIVHKIERLYGIRHEPEVNFPGFSNELLLPKPAEGPAQPPKQPTPGVKPAEYGPGMSRNFGGTSSTRALASAGLGFRPVTSVAKGGSCPTCDKRR